MLVNCSKSSYNNSSSFNTSIVFLEVAILNAEVDVPVVALLLYFAIKLFQHQVPELSESA